jgi:hypothetical protein
MEELHAIQEYTAGNFCFPKKVSALGESRLSIASVSDVV